MMKEVNMEIAMVINMMIIWMIRSDEYHAPSITMYNMILVSCNW